MEDIEYILKNLFFDEAVPLPDNDWEWFSENKLKPVILRKKRIKLFKYISTAAAAIIVAFLIPYHIKQSSTASAIAVPSNENSTDIITGITELVPLVEDTGNLPDNRRLTGRLNTVYENDTAEDSITPTLSDKKDSIANDSFIEPPIKTTPQKREEQVNGSFDYHGNTRRNNIKVSAVIKGFRGRSNSLPGSYLLSDNYHNNSFGLFPAVVMQGLNISHLIPVSFGIDVSFPFASKLAFTTGAELSYYYSSFTGSLETSQKAFFLGIPLRMDMVVYENGPLSVWCGFGGIVDRLIHGQFNSVPINDNRLNFSLQGSAGIRYKLSNNLGLFFSPELSYYLKPSDPDIVTYRNENPLMISIGTGISVYF